MLLDTLAPLHSKKPEGTEEEVQGTITPVLIPSMPDRLDPLKLYQVAS